jgi:hypothetical protein
MKKLPIIRPAIAAEPIEIASKEETATAEFLNTRLYPIELVATSNTMLAAVKPRKKRPPGFNMKLISVATKPTTVAAPNFLTHQNVRLKAAKPSMSHRMGKPKAWNTSGENTAFRTPQRLANSEAAASSRLLKYVISSQQDRCYGIE